LLGFVAANAFEDRGTIAHDVRENVERGVVPIDPFSVVPDFFGLLDFHDGVPFRELLAVPFQFAEYGTREGASMKCTERGAKGKNQIGA
jgi:hypothetical protein